MKMNQEIIAGEITRVSLEGRLDIEGTDEVDQQFSYTTTTRAGRFAVDLSAVTFIASIGIRMLLTAARAQAQRGGKIVLVSSRRDGPQGAGDGRRRPARSPRRRSRRRSRCADRRLTRLPVLARRAASADG